MLRPTNDGQPRKIILPNRSIRRSIIITRRQMPKHKRPKANSLHNSSDLRRTKSTKRTRKPPRIPTQVIQIMNVNHFQPHLRTLMSPQNTKINRRQSTIRSPSMPANLRIKSLVNEIPHIRSHHRQDAHRQTMNNVTRNLRRLNLSRR